MPAHLPRAVRASRPSAVPDFSEIGWQRPRVAAETNGAPRADAGRHRRQRRLPERRYCRARFHRRLAGAAALCPRPLPDDVCRAAVDDPAICRLLDRRGFERLLPAQPRRRAERPVRRLRPRHPPRLRFRSSARRRRRRHGGRRDRFDLRHADAVRRHPARPDQRVDDHERRRAAGDGALHRRRRGAGRAAGGARRDDPERHPQGVHGPQHLHLSARAIAADRRRHPRLHRRAHAEVQFDLGLRLSHAGSRGDGRSRARLHARRRPRICPQPAVAAGLAVDAFAPRHLVLLRHRHELLHGGREAARGAPPVGEADEGALRAEGRAFAVAPHALPDLGLVARGAGRLQQRRAHHDRGDGGDARAAPSRCTPTRSTRRWRCPPTSPPASPATRSSFCRRSPARPGSSIRGAARSTSSG